MLKVQSLLLSDCFISLNHCVWVGVYGYALVLAWYISSCFMIQRDRCSSEVVLDGHGDRTLGRGDGPLIICQDDALCDLLWHALIQDHDSGRKKEQHCCADLDCPGDVFHPVWVCQPTLMLLCTTPCRIPYLVYLLLLLGWLLGIERLIKTVTMRLVFGLLEVFLSIWWWKS